MSKLVFMVFQNSKMHSKGFLDPLLKTNILLLNDVMMLKVRKHCIFVESVVTFMPTGYRFKSSFKKMSHLNSILGLV
jgi:hypothetical protein